MPTVFEFHCPPVYKKGLIGWFIHRFYQSKYLKKIVVISDALKNIFLKHHFENNQLIVAHDASDIPASTQTTINLDKNNFHIGYVGHLYKGKGMEVVQAICGQLTACIFHIVGGKKGDIQDWKQKLKGKNNVIFHGFIPQSHLSDYINSFDVCLLPNQRIVKVWSGDSNISGYTSPLKMFDYMAHNKVIVSSDLPVLKEVLNLDNAILCHPEKAEEWISAIQKLKKDKNLRKNLANQAYQDFINQYTWNKRAKNIIDAIFLEK